MQSPARAGPRPFAPALAAEGLAGGAGRA